MTTAIVIQARMGSARLPGKVLRNICGKTMLARVVERASAATKADTVVVATSVEGGDDAIVRFCEQRSIAVQRGSEHDVLTRYFDAATAVGASIVVRVTADCPLLDPSVVDRVVGELITTGADYASNVLPPRTFPRGLDVEAFTFAALEIANAGARLPEEREHVTPYIRNRPEVFDLRGVYHERDLSSVRWTVDTVEDYELVTRLQRTIGEEDHSWRTALRVFETHPTWATINAHVQQK
jgi:spore coat polysaccharide biosynthesis protein SpsF